jgi:hypothetical protein
LGIIVRLNGDICELNTDRAKNCHLKHADNLACLCGQHLSGKIHV